MSSSKRRYLNGPSRVNVHPRVLISYPTPLFFGRGAMHHPSRCQGGSASKLSMRLTNVADDKTHFSPDGILRLGYMHFQPCSSKGRRPEAS
jgi:hypothetical protein